MRVRKMISILLLSVLLANTNVGLCSLIQHVECCRPQ